MTGRTPENNRLPRIPPVSPDDRTDVQGELLGRWGSDANVFATLVRHDRLFAVWQPFAQELLKNSAFNERDRELIILRVAWRCSSRYEWAHHVVHGHNAGLSDTEIVAVATPKASELSDGERILLTAVDELLATRTVDDNSWTELGTLLTDEQLMELPFLVGGYAMLAGALGAFRVQLEGPGPAVGFVETAPGDEPTRQ